MSHILVDYGEEYVNKNGLSGLTLNIGLYNDVDGPDSGNGDNVDDSFDHDNIVTEPSNTNYARQSDTFSVVNHSGDFGIENDATQTFDFSDVASGDSTDVVVDSYFVTVTFDSQQDTDGSVEHLLFTGSLSQDYQTGDINSLDLDPGAVAFSMT